MSSLNVSNTVGAKGTRLDCNGFDRFRTVSADQADDSEFQVLAGATDSAAAMVPLFAPDKFGELKPVIVRGDKTVQIECASRYMATMRLEGTSAVTATVEALSASASVRKIAPFVQLPGGATIAAIGPTVTEAFTVSANSITLTSGTTVAGSDSTYYTFSIGYWRSGSYTEIVTVHTKTTAGLDGVAAGVPETLTHSVYSAQVGDILAATSTKTSTPTSASFVVSYPPA